MTDACFQLSLFMCPQRERYNIQGCRVAITGKLAIPRKTAISLINASGGIYSSSVSATTDYLVVGGFCANRSTSRKLKSSDKVISSGGKLKVITPEDLYACIGLL